MKNWIKLSKIFVLSFSLKFSMQQKLSVKFIGRLRVREAISNGFGHFKQSEIKFSNKQKLNNSTSTRRKLEGISTDLKTNKKV